MRAVRLLPRRLSGLAQSVAPGAAAVAALAGLLVACSVDGTLTPPADIGSVGSITPFAANQPPPSDHALSGTESRDPFPGKAPVQAVEPESAPAAAQAASDAAFPAQDATPDDQSEQPVVSVMDTDAVVEGTTREPVVTGIGTGSPRRLGAPPSQLAPAPTALSAPAADADPAEPEPQFAFNARPLNPATPAASSQVPRAAPLAPPQAAPMSASARACRQALRRLGVRFTELPAISHGRSCGIAHPIRVTELSGGIRIRPAATLNCPVTLEFAKWIKDEVAPAARARYLSGIESIHQLSSYSCRTMNSQKGAPMSEHAHGNAIDIGSFTLNSGRTVDVRKPGLFAFRQRGFLNTVRADSCGYFNTVLGPGSNKYHWNHFHFDLRQRKSGRSYCE